MKDRFKQVIILRHNGGRLGNQLILAVSIYAYCLERGFSFSNYTFYEYDRFFNLPNPKLLSKLFSYIRRLNFYKAHALTYILYKAYSLVLPLFQPGTILSNLSEENFLLPPSKSSRSDTRTLKEVEGSDFLRIYIDGWAFRNPEGIKKYHKQITKLFAPKVEIKIRVDRFIKKAKRGKKKIIGIHIRQGDYRVFLGGSLYFNQSEVFNIIRFFVKNKRINTKNTRFIICSDEEVDQQNFPGFDVILGPGRMIEDLFVLSECDEILGSKSTFGQFAAYYGNKPLYFFDRKKKFVKQAYGF